MKIPNQTFLNGLHEYQVEVLEAFDAGEPGNWLYDRFFTEWARRHRKTTMWLNILIREACRYPNCAYAHIFPLQTEARKAVWDNPDMLKRYLPDKVQAAGTPCDWKMNEQTMTIYFANGSLIKFGGADDPDGWRGPDYVGVVFDEAKHIKEVMWTAIILPIMKGPLPPEKKALGMRRWAAFCYTPEGNNWATDLMDSACCLGDGGILPDRGKAAKMKPRNFASRLDAEKAGILSAQDLAEAREEMPIAMYDQEFRCSRVTQEERTLITSEMLVQLPDVNSIKLITNQVRKIVAIDPAFTGDVCKIGGMINGAIEPKDERSVHPTKTNEIIMEGKQIARQIATKNFIVDTGWNPGVADALADDEAGYNVIKFNSAAAPLDDRFYANMRAEGYAYAAKQISQGRVPAVKSEELRRQLPVAARYKTSTGGRLLIIPKDQIRKVLGRSPDDADMWMMGLYGLQRVEPEDVRKVERSGPPKFVTLGVG
jgi:hypothetical protein